MMPRFCDNDLCEFYDHQPAKNALTKGEHIDGVLVERRIFMQCHGPRHKRRTLYLCDACYRAAQLAQRIGWRTAG